MILKLTVLLVLTGAADLAMRRTSAALRHLLWSLSLVAALLLPLWSFAIQHDDSARFVIHTSVSASPAKLLAPAKFAWLMAAYLTGVAFFLLQLIRDVLAANRLVRNSRPAHLPNVHISPKAVVPFAWGVIVVPAAFEEWTRQRQESVVAHEAAHLARHDRATTLLARLACAIYWFHPLAWIAAAKIRLEADRACDDAVLRSGFSRESYAAALVHIARNLRANALAPGAVHPSQLELRVRHILASDVNRRNLSTAAVGCMVAACLAAAYPIAALSEQSSASVTHPSVLNKIDPSYTEEARAQKVAGTVLLSLVVGADGKGHDVHVIRSLNAGLDANAVQAIQQWRFKPGMKSGRAVDTKAKIEVKFRLYPDNKDKKQ